MGGGTDVALETADAAVLKDRVGGVAELVQLSRATLANVKQSVAVAVGLKGFFLVTTLAGITGSASGGMSIALATMANHFIEVANTAGIPLEVLHRVASMASGGMDTLPHNGAVITLLAVTGLTHKQSYKDIFAVTVIKTSAVFVVIAFYYLTGIY